MVRWSSRASVRRGALKRSDRRLVIGLVVIMTVLAAYAYRAWKTPPLSQLAGVAWVADADTLEISGARIRLQGIDAPELDQTCADAKGEPWSCGRIAARELRAHVQGREVRCEPQGYDRFERRLATCFLPDGSNLNAWMVEQGWALASGWGDLYQSEQQQAKAAKRGIWTGTFTPPRIWREHHAR
jgi:endonuclease YncB( thermonuclease family)